MDNRYVKIVREEFTMRVEHGESGGLEGRVSKRRRSGVFGGEHDPWAGRGDGKSQRRFP